MAVSIHQKQLLSICFWQRTHPKNCTAELSQSQSWPTWSWWITHLSDLFKNPLSSTHCTCKTLQLCLTRKIIYPFLFWMPQSSMAMHLAVESAACERLLQITSVVICMIHSHKVQSAKDRISSTNPQNTPTSERSCTVSVQTKQINHMKEHMTCLQMNTTVVY